MVYSDYLNLKNASFILQSFRSFGTTNIRGPAFLVENHNPFFLMDKLINSLFDCLPNCCRYLL